MSGEVVVAVTAPATGGRATEAARRALAEALGLRAAAVSLRATATGEVTGRLQVLRGGSR